MPANTVFLNCRVRRGDGSPVVGVHVRSVHLAQPETIFDGYTDSSVELWEWYDHHTTEPRKCWLRCSEGSHWRILFEVTNHTFPGISADLGICGTSNNNANITLTIASNTFALSNGSVENISRRSGVDLRDLTPGSPGPYFVGPRRSSSSLSSISSFTLESEYVISLSDARYFVAPLKSPQSPGKESEAGDIALEDWVETQRTMEEHDYEECLSTNDLKCRQDENNLFEDHTSVKCVSALEE